MKFKKKGDYVRKPIGALYPGDLFFLPNEEDIYMFLESNDNEGVNLATGEVVRFEEFMDAIPIDGELVWNFRAE